MRIDKKRASTLFALTLLIASLLLVSMNGRMSATELSEPVNTGSPKTAGASISPGPIVVPDPAVIEIPFCEEGDIAICVENFTDLAGFSFKIWWLKDVVDYTGYEWKPFPPEWPAPMTAGPAFEENATHKSVAFAITGAIIPPVPPFSYSGRWPFIDIYWHCLVPGVNSPLIFDRDPAWTVLIDEMGLPIPIEKIIDGLIINPSPPEDLELYPREVVNLEDPFIIGTQWHELHPSKSNFYQITDWYPGRVLSPTDQIDMERVEPPGPPDFFWVEEVTIDLLVFDYDWGMYRWLHYECGYWVFKKDVWESPVCSKWIEIKNEMEGPVVPQITWHLTNWFDDGDGKLGFCDDIEMTPMHPFPGPPTPFHVEQVTVTLKLTSMQDFTLRYLEFMGSLEEFQAMDYIHYPESTMWHEILPMQGQMWHLAYWYDYIMFSPSDQIVLTLKDPETHEPIPGTEAEYHVDKLTVAMNLTSMFDGMEHIVKFEGSLEQFKHYHWMEPISTQWHEVNPTYCRQWHIIDWLDGGELGLSYCDLILMVDKEDGWTEEFHVESLSTDMWVTRKVHDVAVTDVESLLDWVYQGQIDPISVTVTNLGDFNEPVVDVYAFYDGNLAALKQTISLNVGETQVLVFNWNTAGVPPGFYTVSANATIPVDDVPGNNYREGNVQEVRELPPPPEDLELYPREVVDLEDPFILGTQWHELHPSKSNFYQILSWEPGMVLSPEDLVFMDGFTFQVDEVTIGIRIWDELEGIYRWLYYECGYWVFKKDVWTDPVCSKWIEIKNDFGPVLPPRCWHLTYWEGDGDGKLSYGDFIEMTPTYPYPGPPRFCVVEYVSVFLKLTEEPAPLPPVQHYLICMEPLETFQDMDYIHMPYGTWWHEILPMQGLEMMLMDWYDAPFLSPSDQIVLTLKDPETHEPIPGTEAEYHVDKLTVAMNLTSTFDGMEHIVKFEGSLKQFKHYHWMEPISTQWHEVNPTYCRQWHITDWLDSGMEPGILDFGDYILMVDKEDGWTEEFYVESLSTDMWVTQKICSINITDIVISHCGVPVDAAFQTWTVQVDVTAHNNGTTPINCNVNAYYYNATTTVLIGTQPITNLAPCNTITLTFNWNLAGVPWCANYTVKANATCTCKTGPASDEFVDDTIRVRRTGDVSGEDMVTGLDVQIVTSIANFMKNVPPADPYADVSGECMVTGLDVQIITSIANFMKACPP